MATIDKKRAVKMQKGLPTKEQIMTAPQNTDTIPAQVSGMDGTPQGPAALTEGEFVFSLPAIIALGQGDYDAGLQMLEQMHTELMTIGEQMLQQQQQTPQQQGLAGAI
jgi:hypothetical protein